MSCCGAFPVSASLEEASVSANDVMTKLKNPHLMALYNIILRTAVMTLPLTIFRGVFIEGMDSITCAASNMIGSLNAPWTFGGKKVDWICQTGNPFNIVSIGMNTLGDTVKISVMADKGVFPQAAELGNKITQILKE